MKIVGVSAGRKNKVTQSVIEAVLAGTGLECQLISLSGKKILPCEACNGCVNNNRCILDDDFLPVMDAVCAADAVVFGAPTYWDHINAKAQCFWERACFSGRHNAVFPLEGKPGVIVAVDGIGDGRHVLRDVGIYFDDARIHLAGQVIAQGEYACFSCGHGNYCAVGGFKELFPLGTAIVKDKIPSISNQHPECPAGAQKQRDLTTEAEAVGAMLARVVKKMKTAADN